MPRTGSTFVVRLLRDWPDVTRVGMHEPAPPEVRTSGRAILASIRNPWDWYVSQWTIGCGGAGTLHRVTTRKGRQIERGPARGAIFDPAPWRRVYADSSARDVGAFRAWLELLSNPAATRVALPLAFGASDLHRYAGWYTYRYAQLFCSMEGDLHRENALPNMQALRTAVGNSIYVTHMAHTERIGSDLVAALDDAGVAMTNAQRRSILDSPPFNRSHRSLPLHAYYDDATWQLVAGRDRLILERHAVAPRNSLRS